MVPASPHAAGQRPGPRGGDPAQARGQGDRHRHGDEQHRRRRERPARQQGQADQQPRRDQDGRQRGQPGEPRPARGRGRAGPPPVGLERHPDQADEHRAEPGQGGNRSRAVLGPASPDADLTGDVVARLVSHRDPGLADPDPDPDPDPGLAYRGPGLTYRDPGLARRSPGLTDLRRTAPGLRQNAPGLPRPIPLVINISNHPITRSDVSRLNSRHWPGVVDILMVAGGPRWRRRLVSRGGVAGRAVARAHESHCTGDGQPGGTWSPCHAANGTQPGGALRAQPADSAALTPCLTRSFTNYIRILTFTARIMGGT
jgi:hypothetical protein